MARCAGITRSGERCRLEATEGSFCWSHAPETSGQRQDRARKGGKAGGNGRPRPRGELDDLKGQLSALYAGVLDGEVEPKRAAVAAQIANARARLLELECKLDQLSGRWMTPGEALELVEVLEHSLRRNVADRAALNRIGRDLQEAAETMRQRGGH